MRKLWVMLLVLMFAGAVRAQDTLTIPPIPPIPGELVPVGDHRLHLYCVGAGSPTVILEPGFARFSLNMRGLQNVLAAEYRVCAYDHAGFGWSEPAPLPRTSQTAADDLAALLENAGEEPPYLLVAHSLGGFVARLFASQYPNRTAGIVLLDATPPEFLGTPETAQSDQMLEMFLQMTLATAQSGEWTPQSIAPIMSLTDDLAAADRDAFIALAAQPQFLEAALSEWQNRLTSAQQVIDAGIIGDIPLTVLVAGARLALASEADSMWVRDQLAQAGISARSEFSVAFEGEHNFYVTQPEIVLRAVRRLATGL